jgi:uncharacterized protein
VTAASIRRGGGSSPTAKDVWRDAALFVVLAVALSWIPWLVVVATGGDPAMPSPAMALWMLGGLGPAAAAVVVAARSEGRPGLGLLLAGLRRWRMGRWYILLLAPLPVAVLAVLLAVATGPAQLDLTGLSQWYLLPGLFLWAVAFGGLEEIGWRGYLLPRLQDRHSALGVSVVIGLVWALWHAPLFAMVGTSQTSMSIGWFTLQAVALSVLLTAVYNATGGGLLLVVLAHGAVTAWYSAVLQWLAPAAAEDYLPYAALILVAAAGTVVWRLGPQNLARRPRQRRR